MLTRLIIRKRMLRYFATRSGSILAAPAPSTESALLCAAAFFLAHRWVTLVPAPPSERGSGSIRAQKYGSGFHAMSSLGLAEEPQGLAAAPSPSFEHNLVHEALVDSGAVDGSSEARIIGQASCGARD